jgi:gluconate kinase
MNRDTIPSSPVRIVVMGVAGSGKTTLARPLAERLGAQLIEADDLHPQSNIA